MEPSHSIESTMTVWRLIEQHEAIRVLFIEATPFCPWTGKDKAYIRIRDRNAHAAAHTLGTIAFGQPPEVIKGLQALAWECDAIDKKRRWEKQR